MFTLDAKAAKAGSGGSSRIDSTGKYVGKVKFAKTWLADSGARMVSIKFEADSGQSADIRICTHAGNAKDNVPTYGYKQVQAIMACIKARDLTPVEQTVEDYDHEAGEVRPIKRTIFKELTGTKLGLALYRHDQTNSTNGNDYFSMEIAAPFNAETEQTAQEILDSKPAETLPKIVMAMKDKDSRTSGGGGAQTGGYGSYPEAGGGNDFSDDIPF